MESSRVPGCTATAGGRREAPRDQPSSGRGNASAVHTPTFQLISCTVGRKTPADPASLPLVRQEQTPARFKAGVRWAAPPRRDLDQTPGLGLAVPCPRRAGPNAFAVHRHHSSFRLSDRRGQPTALTVFQTIEELAQHPTQQGVNRLIDSFKSRGCSIPSRPGGFRQATLGAADPALGAFPIFFRYF